MHTKLLAALLLTLSWQAFGAEGRPTHYQVTRPMQIQQQLEAAYLAKGVGYRPRTEHLEADGSPRYLNRLILEDSPYLLQHAHNPVDWYPWGEAGEQTNLPLHRLLHLPLVPCDGTGELRE